MTRVQVELRSCDQSHCKNEALSFGYAADKLNLSDTILSEMEKVLTFLCSGLIKYGADSVCY